MATALAVTFAESISMGAVAYTSRLAERDYYVSPRQGELDEIVDGIAANETTWRNGMMSEELQHEPVDTDPAKVTRTALGSAATVKIADAPVADQTGALHDAKGVQGLDQRHAPAPVQEIQVELIRAEAQQAALAGGDGPRRVACRAGLC